METMHAVGRRRLPPVPRPAAERAASGRVMVGTPADEPDTDQFATQVIDTRQIAAELTAAELAALTEPDATEPDATEVVGETADDETADDETAADADEDELDATAKLTLAELATLMADDDAPAAAVEPESEEPESEEPESEEPHLSEPHLSEPDPSEAGREVPEPAAGTDIDEQDPAQLFVAGLRSSAADFAGAAGADSAVVREAVPPARHRRARCRLVLRFADGDLADVTLLGPAGAPGRPSRHGFDRQILRWLGSGLAQDRAWLVDDPDAPDGLAVDLTAWVAAS